jgi:branched-subunit amino acid aminotransferase/4-amino-4-deoxychorismate lyase
MTGLVMVDGVEHGSMPATDSSVLRGDGCFEAIRSYGGRLFALDEHLTRLEKSASALGLPRPDIDRVSPWCVEMAARLGDGVVRVVMSRGDVALGGDGTPRYAVLGLPLPSRPAALALATVEAPWHPAGREWALAGAKTISYAPNLSAGRQATAAGYDDALLVSADGIVLEGPTFSVAWVVDGAIETPGLDLFILDSITRRRVLRLAGELGFEVRQGRFPSQRIQQASEVLALSTVKEVTAVRRVDSFEFGEGPVRASLQAAFAATVRTECAPTA